MVSSWKQRRDHVEVPDYAGDFWCDQLPCLKANAHQKGNCLYFVEDPNPVCVALRDDDGETPCGHRGSEHALDGPEEAAWNPGKVVLGASCQECHCSGYKPSERSL